MGLFYTALSRATTLGNKDGQGSAIYFRGSHFKRDRFSRLGKKKHSDEDYAPIKKRELWVNYLKHHTQKITEVNEDMKAILHWSESSRFDYETLHKRINSYVKAKSDNRSF